MTDSMRDPLARPAVPLMLAGHGTVDATGVAEFVSLTDRLRTLLAAEGVDVDGGFVELSQPAVHEAWARLSGRGHTHRAAVPMVLVGAGHATGDIPAALEREVHREPGSSYVSGRSLGPHPVLLEILATRVAEVAPAAGTAVLLVGRGSTDPDANAEVAKIARLLQEGRGYDFVEPAFVSLTRPDVGTGLARCRALGATRVVVAPYLLFDGVLPRRVADQTAAFAAAHPDLDVRCAGHLGDTDALAGLVVERYREALHGDIRMNCDTCAYRVSLPGSEDGAPHHHPDPVGTGHGHAHGHAG